MATNYQTFCKPNTNTPLEIGLTAIDILAHVAHDTIALKPVSAVRKNDGSGSASFVGDIVQPDLIGRHVTVTLNTPKPSKSDFYDFGSLRFRTNDAEKIPQTHADNADSVAFGVWYAGKEITVQPNDSRTASGSAKGKKVSKIGYSGGFAIGSTPFTVTVVSTLHNYSVKTVNGRKVYTVGSAVDSANPAQPNWGKPTQPESQPAETAQDSETASVESVNAELANA